MNTLSEYLEYIKQNNQSDDLSKYFSEYISEKHPEEIINFNTEDKSFNNPILNKISNPLITTSSNIKINPAKNNINSPSVTSIISPPSLDNKNSFKTKEDFIKTILPYAKKIAQEKGIDENIIISQAAFESGYGKNTLTKKANNIFSIQGKGFAHKDKNQKGEIYNVQFKSYKDLGESLNDWSNMVLNPNSKRYSKSYLAAKQTPEEFFKVHSWSGYAEGVGKTKEEAKQKIYEGYKNTYNEVVNLRKKYNI